MNHVYSRRRFVEATAVIAFCIPSVAGLTSCSGEEKYTAEYFKNTKWQITETRATANSEWIDNRANSMFWEFTDNGRILTDGNDTNSTWEFKNNELYLNLAGKLTYSGGGYTKDGKLIGKFMLNCDDASGENYPYMIEILKV